MAEYEIRDSNGKCKRYCEDPRCLPDEKDFSSMYGAGLRLFVDGKKKTLMEALKFIPEDLYGKQARRK